MEMRDKRSAAAVSARQGCSEARDCPGYRYSARRVGPWRRSNHRRSPSHQPPRGAARPGASVCQCPPASEAQQI